MFKIKLLKRLKLNLLPQVIWTLIYFIGKTNRFTILGEKKYRSIEGPVIFAFWHNRIFLLPYYYRYILKKKNICVLASPSTDGEILARTFAKLRFSVARGSTRHYGKNSMVEMITRLKKGYDGAIVPDGPQGPRYEVKDGIVRLARKVALPLIPVAYNTSRRKTLSTWDLFLLPLPFSRTVLIYGDPLVIDEGMDEKVGRRLLEERLKKITQQADEYFD